MFVSTKRIKELIIDPKEIARSNAKFCLMFPNLPKHANTKIIFWMKERVISHDMKKILAKYIQPIVLGRNILKLNIFAIRFYK